MTSKELQSIKAALTVILARLNSADLSANSCQDIADAPFLKECFVDLGKVIRRIDPHKDGAVTLSYKELEPLVDAASDARVISGSLEAQLRGMTMGELRAHWRGER